MPNINILGALVAPSILGALVVLVWYREVSFVDYKFETGSSKVEQWNSAYCIGGNYRDIMQIVFSKFDNN